LTVLAILPTAVGALFRSNEANAFYLRGQATVEAKAGQVLVSVWLASSSRNPSSRRS